MSESFIKNLISINICMLIGGLIAFLYMNSKKYLTSQNYSETYIKARKQFGLRSGLIQLMTLLLSEALFVTIISKLRGSFLVDDLLTYVIPLTFFVLIPVTILESRKFNKVYKKLAEETGEDVVVDFNHSLLNNFFKLIVEIPFTLVYLILAYFAFHTMGFTTLLYSILIPWMFYFVSRFSKNMNRASFKETYSLMFQFNNLYMILLAVMSIAFSLHSFIEKDTIRAVLSISCICLIIAKSIYTFNKYPKLKKELNKIDIKQ